MLNVHHDLSIRPRSTGNGRLIRVSSHTERNIFGISRSHLRDGLLRDVQAVRQARKNDARHALRALQYGPAVPMRQMQPRLQGKTGTAHSSPLRLRQEPQFCLQLLRLQIQT